MAKCLYEKEITIKRKDNDLNKNEKARIIKVRCRKCFNCQITKRKNEIQRVIDESKYYKYYIFLTLTYDNKNIRLRDYISEVINNNQLTKKEKYNELIAFDKSVDFIRNYNNEYDKDKNKAIEKFLYYHLINEYATLHYNDIKKYLDTLKKAIKRDKDIINKDFKYYGCGEYPYIKTNRGRPHYHVIYLFNDSKLIKYFIKAWKLGNISIMRGDNQIDESLNLLDLRINHNNNKNKLDMLIKQETINNDIARIYDYIKNKKINISVNNETRYSIFYTASYTNKKINALLIESIENRNKEINKYYTIKDLYKDIEYKEIREIMKKERETYLKNKKKGIIGIEKEETFTFKSNKLGMRYAIDNRDRFIKDITINNKMINDYYIRVINESVKKTNQYNIILYNKNEIISELKIKDIENLKDVHKDLEYSIIKYKDNSIDIVDKTNNKLDFNIYTIQLTQRQYSDFKEKEKRRIFNLDKDYKSDTFKIDLSELKNELEKHKNNLNQYINEILNRKYDNLKLY